MSKSEKLLQKLRNHATHKNFNFDDLINIVLHLGFHEKTRGGTSHRIFQHPNHPRIMLNLQPGRDGAAKPSQVKQVLEVLIAIEGK